MTEKSVYITNTASFLPNPPVGNDEMERILGQVGDKPSRVRRTILRSNKIQQRHYAIDPVTLKPNFTNASMTAEAIRKLENDSFSIKNLDCLSCGTTIPDQLMPNHALMVQGELKTNACEAVATAGVCLSGVTAMKYAYLAIRAGEHQVAVASGSEMSSPLLRAKNFAAETEASPEDLEQKPELAFDKDFLRWMLSDGAGAVLLEPHPARGRLSLRIDWIDVISYAGEMPACMYAGAVQNQDGTLSGWTNMTQEEVMANSVMTAKQDIRLLNEHIMPYTVTKALTSIKAARKLNPADIDHFLPHYSSGYFRDKVYECMKAADFEIPRERWFTNLSSKGNTGAAAFYIMLDEIYHSGNLKAGERLLCYVPESGRFSTAFIHLTVV